MRVFVLLSILLNASIALGADNEQLVCARMDEAAARGEMLVAHVVVALADNDFQGIVPVPKAIGNGQKPETNLYWGAGYGVRYFFGKKAGWKELKVAGDRPKYVLDRVAFQTTVTRGGKKVPVVVIADAYDGSRIEEATVEYFEFSAGRHSQALSLVGVPTPVHAGGAAHLVAYVGHDGLMDFPIAHPSPAAPDAPPRAALVLACISRDYFGPLLDKTGAFKLLMTSGLMAPEAYTLDAAIREWFAGGTATAVREKAAHTYDQYQHCGVGGAKRLFGVPARKASAPTPAR